jgi:glyceraldehyde 3-phosphate dehydrogenase
MLAALAHRQSPVHNERLLPAKELLMTIRVGLMGFGRIGRNVFRAIYERDDLEVVAINEIADVSSMEYLLRFDSLRGIFDEPVRARGDALYAKARRIPVLHHREPGEIPWYDHGVDVVVEATGRYRTRAELQRHLDQGAGRVVLTTPPGDEVDCLHIRGVTAEGIDRAHRIFSCGSSTANCTAVMIKVLDDAFGVDEAFFTSVHAYTGEQSLIDSPSGSHLRRSRAAVENIVPMPSWTAMAIGQIFEHLEGRFTGSRLNVPVPSASCIDLTTHLRSNVTVDEVNEVFRSASASTMRGVLEFTEQPIVSSDVQDSPYSSTFDSLATMIVGSDLVKTIGWYEQGGGLAHRVVDLVAELGPANHEATTGSARS